MFFIFLYFIAAPSFNSFHAHLLSFFALRANMFCRVFVVWISYDNSIHINIIDFPIFIWPEGLYVFQKLQHMSIGNAYEWSCYCTIFWNCYLEGMMLQKRTLGGEYFKHIILILANKRLIWPSIFFWMKDGSNLVPVVTTFETKIHLQIKRSERE